MRFEHFKNGRIVIRVRRVEKHDVPGFAGVRLPGDEPSQEASSFGFDYLAFAARNATKIQIYFDQVAHFLSLIYERGRPRAAR